MNHFQKALRLMPSWASEELRKLNNSDIEEIRVRLGHKLYVVISGKEWPVSNVLIKDEDINRIIEIATGASYHIAEHSINEGYINFQGLRIGVCGRFNVQKGSIHSIGKINSLAIRIASEHRGVLDKIFKDVYARGFENSLIVSPPGGGKTTALRELCRKLSGRGYRVSVVDERNELVSDDGCEGFDLGEHCDVLSCAPKAEGSLMLLKSMNPEIIAMDEITSQRDIEAVKQILGCGVKVLASAHAKDLDDLRERKLYRELIELKAFEHLIRIDGQGKDRVYFAERMKI